MIQQPDLNKLAMAEADVQEVTASEAPREKEQQTRRWIKPIMFDTDLADYLREKQQ